MMSYNAKMQSNNNELSEILEMAENLPDAGGGGVSVQADWNQTDENAADFIKNKPFGDELLELVPETEVVGEDDGSGTYASMLELGAFSGQESKLFVTFDGVKYTCNDLSSTVSYPYPLFGNLKYFGAEDTGEPFCIIVVADQSVVMVALDDANSHNISISGVRAKKLPTNYYNGVSIFYFRGHTDGSSDDCYLYTDVMCSKMATKEDVGAVLGRLPIMLSAANQLFFTVTAVESYMERQYIALLANNRAFYTYEYTPPTT